MKKKLSKQKVKEYYLEYLLENGKEPVSTYSFAKQYNFDEKEFYTFYPSFRAIDREVWQGIFDKTISLLEKEDAYSSYTVREKLLAFSFTLVEQLKNQKGYFTISWKNIDNGAFGNTVKGSIKNNYMVFLKVLINEGIASGEIASRPLVTDYYKDALWYQLEFVLKIFHQDDSDSCQKTDEAIEKSVNLALDIIGVNALDSFIDFAKFLWRK